jgi:hypothetical protein
VKSLFRVAIVPPPAPPALATGPTPYIQLHQHLYANPTGHVAGLTRPKQDAGKKGKEVTSG